MRRWQSRSSIVSSGTRSRPIETLVITMSVSTKLPQYFSIQDCCPSLTRNTGSKKSDGSVWVWTDQGAFLVVCHTYREITERSATTRIFSARKATRQESNDYGKRKP